MGGVVATAGHITQLEGRVQGITSPNSQTLPLAPKPLDPCAPYWPNPSHRSNTCCSADEERTQRGRNPDLVAILFTKTRAVTLDAAEAGDIRDADLIPRLGRSPA